MICEIVFCDAFCFSRYPYTAIMRWLLFLLVFLYFGSRCNCPVQYAAAKKSYLSSLMLALPSHLRFRPSGLLCGSWKAYFFPLTLKLTRPKSSIDQKRSFISCKLLTQTNG